MKFFVATAIVTALCVGVWRAQNTSNFPAIGHIDRYDAALDSLIASDAKIEVLCGGFEWAEGPVWVPESGNKFGGYVLFSDIPHNAEDSHREIDFCGVYRLQKDGTVTVQRRDISRPNGIAFSPDEKTMYVANSDGQDPVWCAFPVQDDGNPGTPTVFFDSSKDSRIPKGGGDGLKVDADGNVFATGVALAQVAQPAVSSFREKLEALEAEHAASLAEYSEEVAASADETATATAVERYTKHVKSVSEKAFVLVQTHPDAPEVIPALGFIVTLAKGSAESENAIRYLHAHCVKTPGAGSVCHKLFYFFDVPAAETFLRLVSEQNPNVSDRALACHALSFYLRYKARVIRIIQQNPERFSQFVTVGTMEAVQQIAADTDAVLLDEEAARLLQRVITDYGDVEFSGRRLLDIAKGELFRLQHLSVGKVAPEISGTTIDGEILRLSDYDGHVVLLMFSGEWCGNCVAMYPDIRTLSDELAGRPFVVLCVNTDKDLVHLRESMKSGKITWKCWCDGGTDGPITTQWGVSAFPSVFLLDQHRVIRYTDVRRDSLRSSVMSFLPETPCDGVVD